MQNKKNFFETHLWNILFIFIISTIAYLPLIHKLGYLNDDWYLMYDMQVKTPRFFHEIFSVDRPGRALVMIPMFSVFGFNPLPYHISAFMLRFLGGICLYWSLHMLWPGRRFFNFSSALLFTIYPGFLSQPNAIDYQSHQVGLFLALLSVALTIKSMLSLERGPRIWFAISAILSGWGYLSQMEYFIGIEAFRFACIFILIWRIYDQPFWQKIKINLVACVPFLLIAGGFLTWRLFFFESVRKATDVGLQVSQLFSSPLTGLWWLNYLIQDIFSVTLVAWGLPLYQSAFQMRLRDMFSAFGWSVLAVLMVTVGMRQVDKKEMDIDSGPQPDTKRETLYLSLISILGGLLPVILVNRHVTLPDYSRYTLIASIGAIFLLVFVLENIFSSHVRTFVLAFFVSVAVMTHYGNAVKSVNETVSTRNFWWQVAWRVPQIKEGTTLIASYPGGSLSEDYFIWGPANLIYHPEKQNSIPVEIKLPAAVLTNDAVLSILMQDGVETPLRRGNYVERDFKNVLVMIQSSANGCVRLINGGSPELSANDQEKLLLISPFSRLENVITEGDFHVPPSVVFGEEPQHGWCYYYQKADLARQRGEWEQIPILLNKALSGGHYPEDKLEWLPFLQASAVLGDVDHVRNISKLVSNDKFMRFQFCRIMTDFIKKESLNEDVKNVIEKNICK